MVFNFLWSLSIRKSKHRVQALVCSAVCRARVHGAVPFGRVKFASLFSRARVYKQLVLQVRVQLSDVLNGLSEQQKRGGDSGNTCAACKHCREEVVQSCTNELTYTPQTIDFSCHAELSGNMGGKKKTTTTKNSTSWTALGDDLQLCGVVFVLLYTNVGLI